MRKVLKWTGIGIGTLVGIVVLALAVVYAASEMRLKREVQLSVAPFRAAAAATPAQVERGRHLATAIGKCGVCHGPDLGGRVFIDGQPFAKVIAPNLTAGEGGALRKYDDAGLERAIRHGVRHDGRALMVFMPSLELYYLQDDDLAALIAYLRTLPPVNREMPASSLGPIGRALYLAGAIPLLPAEDMDHAAPRPTPAPGVTVEYGKYMATVGMCTGCHGPDLAGSPEPMEPGTPPPANLTPVGLGRWSEADFTRALRTGVRPNGTAINAFMPWQQTRLMTDDEIRALWLYLKTVPPRATPTAD